MSTQVAINTFQDGMDTDSDVSIQKGTTFEWAENLRFIANKDSKTGGLYNIKSSELVHTITSEANTIVNTCSIFVKNISTLLKNIIVNKAHTAKRLC